MVEIPKIITVRFENNGDGTASMEYKEVIVFLDAKIAQFSKEASEQVMKSITSQKNDRVKKKVFKISRIKNQVHASLVIVADVETVVNSIIGEFEAQVTPIKKVDKWMKEGLNEIVGKKEVKRLVEEKKKLIKKHKIDIKKFKR